MAEAAILFLWLNPKHLEPDELEYELLIRGIEPRLLPYDQRIQTLIEQQKQEYDSPRQLQSQKTIIDEVSLIQAKIVSIRNELERKKDTKLITRFKHLYLRTYRANALDSHQISIKEDILVELEFLIETFGDEDDAIYRSKIRRTLSLANTSKVDRIPELEFPTTPQVPRSTGISQAKKNELNPNALNFTPSPVANQSGLQGSIIDMDLIDLGLPKQPSGPKNPIQMVDIEKAIDKVLTGKLELIMNQMFDRFKNLQVQDQQPQAEVDHRPEGRHPLRDDIQLNQSLRLGGIPPPEIRDPPRASGVLGRGNRTDGLFIPRGQDSYREWRQKPIPIDKWQVKYSADAKGPSVEEFLRKVETLAKNNRTSESELLGQANFLFKPESVADEWYYTYSKKFTSWTVFKYLIKLRFGVPNTDKVTEKQIRERKQQVNETFIAYVGEIERLCQKLSKPLDDRYKLNIIIDNMRNSYRPHLAFINLDHITLEDLTSLCFDLDKACYHTYMQPRTKPLNVHNIEEAYREDSFEESDEEVNAISTLKAKQKLKKKEPSSKKTEEGTEDQSNTLCWNCRQFGHFWKDCTKQKKTFCHRCGKVNVVIASCPEKHRFGSEKEKNEQ